jgi:glycosyltransferase involved in cell wall biosynthesis
LRGVVIDATRLVRRALRGQLPTGIDRASLAYIEHYQQQAQAMVVWLSWAFVLPPGVSRRLWMLLLTPGARAQLRMRMIILWGVFGGLCLPRQFTGNVLLNTSHSGLERSHYGPMIRRLGLQAVFLIHDLIPITHPEFCRPGERRRHGVRIRTALEHGAGLITNSQATLQQITDHAEQISIPMPKIVAARLAPGLRRCPPGARPCEAPYFLVLGTIEPRKNHYMLLQLWRRLIEQMGAQAPRLMIVGRRGWEIEHVVDLLERCEPLRDFVIEYPACADSDLNTYLHHARALLYPSMVEGYGLPIIEALALGVPVIASNLPVFREVGGEIPEYIDPLDARGWAEVVMEYAGPGSRLRAQQLQRISHFIEPTWSQHFEIVDQLLGNLHAAG